MWNWFNLLDTSKKWTNKQTKTPNNLKQQRKPYFCIIHRERPLSACPPRTHPLSSRVFPLPLNAINRQHTPPGNPTFSGLWAGPGYQAALLGALASQIRPCVLCSRLLCPTVVGSAPHLPTGGQKSDVEPALPFPKRRGKGWGVQKLPAAQSAEKRLWKQCVWGFFGFGRYSPGASLLRASPQCPSEKDLGSISTHRCWQYWKAKMGEEKEVKLLRQLERKCRILWEGRSACTVGGMEPFRFPPSGRKIEATVNLKVN